MLIAFDRKNKFVTRGLDPRAHKASLRQQGLWVRGSSPRMTDFFYDSGETVYR
jgi:hypothetical protein